MNEDLLTELAEAMKRREKALAAVARWTEQLTDANEDIQELSARIADYAATHGNPPEAPEVADAEAPYVYEPEQRMFEPVQE